MPKKKIEVKGVECSEENGIIALVLDPAISTGYCLLCYTPGSPAIIFAQGHLTVDTSSDYSGDYCIDLQTKLKRLISKYGVNHIAVETFFFSKRFATGSTLNAELRTAIYILARQLGLPYTILGISEWKKFIAGRSTPTKEQVKQWGRERAKKLFIQQALWERFGIRFPNHSISAKTGKPISFKLDVVDAVAQGVYFAFIYLRALEIVSKVEIPKDVYVKGKESFSYPL